MASIVKTAPTKVTVIAPSGAESAGVPVSSLARSSTSATAPEIT